MTAAAFCVLCVFGQTVATLFSLCHCLPPWSLLSLWGILGDFRVSRWVESCHLAGQYFCCQQTFAFHFSTSKNIFTVKHTNICMYNKQRRRIWQIVRRLPFVFSSVTRGRSLPDSPTSSKDGDGVCWSICHFKWLIHMQVASGAKHIQVF